MKVAFSGLARGRAALSRGVRETALTRGTDILSYSRLQRPESRDRLGCPNRSIDDSRRSKFARTIFVLGLRNRADVILQIAVLTRKHSRREKYEVFEKSTEKLLFTHGFNISRV